MSATIDKKWVNRGKLDDPPNSRLFIIGSKLLTEADFRDVFQRFGNIEEIWMVKDKHTGQNKGVTYIKYSKTSEAAKALEAMNGKCIGKLNRSIRVMIAANREQGSKRESNEEEKTQRLFVIVPKNMTDLDLFDHFKRFGDIDYATVVRDKETLESKGFAYVKYFKFSHAAEAFENCDRTFRAIFAEPRKPNIKCDTRTYSPNTNSKMSLSLPTTSSVYTKLVAIVSPQINQDQLWKLFDIVPGLDFCDMKLDGHLNTGKAIALIAYNNPQSAAYAKDKLHGFEYPLGHRLIVKLCESFPNLDDDTCDFLDKIAQKNDFLSEFVPTAETVSSSSHNALDCSIKLPEVQLLAPAHSSTVSRCFIVCNPHALPPATLKNIFCRFGALIDVYMLNNRNCGFAKYATKESAESAIRVLNGVQICGVHVKVIEAEDKEDKSRKRQRIGEN